MQGVVSLLKAVGIWVLVVVVTFGVGLIAVAAWAGLVFLGAAGRAGKANALIDKTLMPGETVAARAIQHRVFALFQRRKAIAITGSRILVIQRGLLGGFRMSDMQWKDLKDVRIEENVLTGLCGANLVFDHLAGAAIAVAGVPAAAAAQMYAKAQYEEQAWEEKRRVRGLEETRAASGGVTIGGGDGAGGGSGERMVEEIAKAKALLDAGAVSDAEFQEMKAKILGRA